MSTENPVYLELEEIREKLGFDYTRFCSFLGVARSTFWRWKLGEVYPPKNIVVSARFGLAVWKLAGCPAMDHTFTLEALSKRAITLAEKEKRK